MRLTALIAAATVAALSSFGFATESEAKQCVWNKGGFVLRIDWFKPNAVSSTVNPNDGYREMSFTEQPAQTDVIWAGSGRCIDRGATTYLAVLSACGGSFPMRVVKYPPDWSPERRIDCAMFAVQEPSTTRYFDVWGAIWDPDFGPGGPI